MNYVRESLNKYSIEFVNIGSTLIQDFSLLRLCGNSRLREQLAPNRIIFILFQLPLAHIATGVYITSWYKVDALLIGLVVFPLCTLKGFLYIKSECHSIIYFLCI